MHTLRYTLWNLSTDRLSGSCLARYAHSALISVARWHFKSFPYSVDRCFSTPAIFVVTFWEVFSMMAIILWVWRCLAIVDMLGTFPNVYFRSRDFALSENNLNQQLFAPALVIFSIEAFWSFWVNIMRLHKVKNKSFYSRFFSKAIFYYILTGWKEKSIWKHRCLLFQSLSAWVSLPPRRVRQLKNRGPTFWISWQYVGFFSSQLMLSIQKR